MAYRLDFGISVELILKKIHRKCEIIEAMWNDALNMTSGVKNGVVGQIRHISTLRAHSVVC